jgi:hypothetical protein
MAGIKVECDLTYWEGMLRLEVPEELLQALGVEHGSELRVRHNKGGCFGVIYNPSWSVHKIEEKEI